MRRIVPALILLCLFVATAFAQAPAPVDTEGLILAIYRAIADGAWFPAAGAVTLLLLLAARTFLLPRFPSIGSAWWGVGVLAALAGGGALGHAWLAEAPLDATTLIGAAKVFATAALAYFAGGRLLAAKAAGAAALLVVALGASTLATQAGCPGPGPGPVIADSVIDCLGETRPRIDALILELSPLVFLSSPDWSAVYQRAKQAGKELGGCVIAELVQRYLAPSPGRMGPEPLESWRAHEILNTYRRNEVGGASFKTAYGNL